MAERTGQSGPFPASAVSDPVSPRLAEVEALLHARHSSAALKAAVAFERDYPARVDGAVLAGRALQLLGRLADASQAASRALERSPRHPAARMLSIELKLALGETAAGLDALAVLAAEPTTTGSLRQDVARLYTSLNLHREAERCFAADAALAPANAEYHYNWATALTALGKLAEAEAALDRTIALAPGDGDAYYNRSTLRRQSASRNHVAEIEACLARGAKDPNAAIALEYALAKELEDLGESTRSFAALRRGAKSRRQRLSYRVEDDLDAMRAIARVFGASYRDGASPGCRDGRPIVVVGLPRSGTTLIDRILSSHSDVSSRGESSDFGAAVMRHASPARSKLELIERAARVDPATLGADYVARLPPGASGRIVDKTPLNFLYVGLIRKALPEAAIVHVRRRPLDVCYAMLKTLFRMAYPFSYSLEDLGRYYLGYRELMSYWRALEPASMFELDYEDLIENQEAVSRRLLAHCGLDWEPECLAFERNASPSLTASAAQVREPLYRSSMDLASRYAAELEPLSRVLRAAGIDPDGPA